MASKGLLHLGITKQKNEVDIANQCNVYLVLSFYTLLFFEIEIL